jgi:hypothetical protein
MRTTQASQNPSATDRQWKELGTVCKVGQIEQIDGREMKLRRLKMAQGPAFMQLTP